MVNTEEEFTKLVIPALKKQGIGLFVESYDIQTSNFKDIAAKVKNFNPDVILLNGFSNNLVGIIRAFRPFGLIKDDNTMGSFDMLDTAAILSKEEIEKITVSAPLFMLNPKQKVIEWNQRFKNRFGRQPVYTDAFSYDMVQIIHDASKRIENPATAPSNKWIDALRATNIEGITGPLKFDNDGDLAVQLGLGTYYDGKLILRTSPTVKTK